MAEAPLDEDQDAEDGPEIPSADPTSYVTGLALGRLSGGSDDQDARMLFRDQARMLRLQAEHLHEQREVQLSHLKARRISEWLKVALQVMTAMVGLLVAGLVGALILDAALSRTVVVDAFDAPPALAARGETGKVVANSVLDGLTRLQAATRATAAKRKLAGAWSGDIKIEVPETGVTVGELKSLLHGMFGHDVHVDGDLVQEADGGLALTVRGDDITPKTFTGGAGDLDALAAKASEYVYGQADPYLLAAYLSTAGRSEDALAFLAEAYPRARPEERPDLLNQWGNALFGLDRLPEAVAKYRAAVALRGDFWKAWSNLVLVLEGAESEEAAYREGLRMAAAADRSARNDRPRAGLRNAFDALVQDWGASDRDLISDMDRYGRNGTYSTADAAAIAYVEAQRHDWNAAEQDLVASDPDDPSTASLSAMIRADRALEQGDARQAVALLEPAYARYQASASTRAYFPQIPCYIGLAYALSGAAAQAQEAFTRGGRWLSCYSFRGEALEHAGDWNGAVQAYKAAIALGPDLPFAYQRFGLALLRHGSPQAAITEFAAAHARGPHWADPLKGWGDALKAVGRPAEAADRYAEALAYAPHWQALNDAAKRS